MSKKSDVLRPQLWTPRPVEETMEVYAAWADTYDAEVQERGYRTPARLAAALTDHVPRDAKLLDFGCGTGLSGLALKAQGFTTIHGTDISAEMLDKARARDLYTHIWLSKPGEIDVETGAYDAILAVGVVSLGAAPADLLDPLIDKLGPGQVIAFSYNDPTLADASYLDALDRAISSGKAELIFREHGPHLDDVGMGSDVIILRRT